MKFKLNIRTWRSGGDEENRLGVGETRLRNEYGYMCCLGQFGRQLGVPVEDMIGEGEPQECEAYAAIKSPFVKKDSWSGIPQRTSLTADLIEINDNDEITWRERAKMIRARLRKAGHSLEIIGLRSGQKL